MTADQDALKQQVGKSAANYIDPFLQIESIIGVGTGSTANYFIDALAKIKHKFDGTVASSLASEERLKSHGIPVYELNGVKEVLFYIDGADETNARFELIKGGGGKLNDEKISDETQAITMGDVNADGVIKLSAGKKRHALINPV